MPIREQLPCRVMRSGCLPRLDSGMDVLGVAMLRSICSYITAPG